jgi:hypothetical protein
MWTKQLEAGAAIVGGVGLSFVGLDAMAVNADASPPVVSNEPDPSGPTFTIEPAPSAPSPDIASDPGISSSTDTGSRVPSGPLPDLNVGGPSDLPPTPSAPPPIEGPTGPVGPPTTNTPREAPPTPSPNDPPGPDADLGHGCRPFWCPHPPTSPTQPPWPWPDSSWLDTSDSWESTTTVLPSPCVAPPPRPDAAPPPPFQYGGQTVAPAFDSGVRQWGFWYLGNWVPLFGSECQTLANSGTAEPHT